MALAVGQIVWLKSGGPAMTVDQIMDKLISCKWFNGATAAQSNFPEAALTETDPREKLETDDAVRRVTVEKAAEAAKAEQP